MGSTNGWLPYLIGALVGHCITVVSWISTAVVTSVLGPNQVPPPYWLPSPPIETDTTTSGTLTSTTFQGGSPKRAAKLSELASADGWEFWLLGLSAIISWCISVTLGICLWRRHRLVVVDSEPCSPTIQELARSQLAELRLRRHGLGESSSPVRI